MQKFVTLKSLLLVVSIGFALSLTSCQRASQQADQAPELIVDLQILPTPAEIGSAELMISIADAESEPVQGADLEVRGDMSHAGMVPVFGQAKEIEAGLYQVPFEWTMAGDWILTINAQLPDGRTLLRLLEVNVISDGGQTMEGM